MKKILIVNPFGIGDVIFSTPLIEILKETDPHIRIGYICNRRVAELMEANPHIDKMFVYEKDEYRDEWKRSKLECLKKILAFLSDIRKERFDISVDFSLTYQSSMLLKLVGIRKRLGFNYRNRGRFLTDKVNIRGFDSKHVIEHYLDMLKLLDIKRPDHSVSSRIYISPNNFSWADVFLKKTGVSATDKIVGLVPGCGASWGKDAYYRRWSAWKFAEAADYVARKYGYKVVIFGDSKEVTLCEKVKSEMKTSPILACGKTTLGQLAALLARCDLVITNDGGPLHMAVALKRKTIAIFGPVDEKIYGPYPVRDIYEAVSSNVPCRPCYKNFKYAKCDKLDCLKNVVTKNVIDAVDRLIGKEELPVKKAGI